MKNDKFRTWFMKYVYLPTINKWWPRHLLHTFAFERHGVYQLDLPTGFASSCTCAQRVGGLHKLLPQNEEGGWVDEDYFNGVGKKFPGLQMYPLTKGQTMAG